MSNILHPDKFFAFQLSVWPECNARYAELDGAKHKTITIEGRNHTLIFNPLRMRSATAKVSDGKVDRPCFLCKKNRPAQQTEMEITPDGSPFAYHLAVNPFPILPNHFTIINSDHCRQTITPQRLHDMAFMARLMQGYLVFFNGACSGASAPDHLHFQAVPQALVPLTEWGTDVWQELEVQCCEAEDVKIDFKNSDFTNILCWNTPAGLHWWIVRRRCHRPWQYSAEGEQKVLMSPASLEFAGVVPLARGEDFEKMDAGLLADIFQQCRDSEPLVDVGICDSSVSKTDNPDGTFSLHGVRIGIGFHWDQKRDFTYEGELIYKTDKNNHSEWAINRLPVEKYLRSVITSEMSATSNLQLLKAHAVISRSWLIRQMQRKHQKQLTAEAQTDCHEIVSDGQILRWYDSHAHLLFDVCADDHCQRYQGIALKANPLVDKAIEETRGEVLFCDGEVCDARFSKCCGGMTEEYKYCWENINTTYLQTVPDTRDDGSVYCETVNPEILRQVLNDYDQSTRDFHTWQVVYTQAEISELIERKLHLGLGLIQSLEAVERGKSGRISRMKIIGSERTVTIGKELEIRKALSETHLYSSNFEVITEPDNTGHTLFIIKGRGWGHGVGLCQIGAAVMGAEGHDYKTILSHYYKNTEIKKIW